MGPPFQAHTIELPLITAGRTVRHCFWILPNFGSTVLIGIDLWVKLRIILSPPSTVTGARQPFPLIEVTRETILSVPHQVVRRYRGENGSSDSIRTDDSDPVISGRSPQLQITKTGSDVTMPLL